MDSKPTISRDEPIPTAIISEAAWQISQQINRNDYLGETTQADRDLGWLAVLVAKLADRVQELERGL